MHYCNGGDLKGLVEAQRKKKGGISQYEAITILKKILLGLQALQSKSVIHRDLKFENILVNFRMQSVPEQSDK